MVNVLPFAKPPLRPKRKRQFIRHRRLRDVARHNAVVAAVRAEVFVLDTVCAVCGGRTLMLDQMHEVRSRSQTRGRPPEERFNRQNCVRLHRDCHRQVTEKLVLMAFVDAVAGMDGGLIVQRRGHTDAVVYRRGTQPPHAVYWDGTIHRGVFTSSGTVGGTNT